MTTPDFTRLGLVHATLKLNVAKLSIKEGRDDAALAYIEIALEEINTFLTSTKEENKECLSKSES